MIANTTALLALFAAYGSVAAPPKVQVSQELIVKTVKTLSSPELEGRMTLSKGGVKAGDFIAAQFKSFGLLPGGDDKSYFFKFPVTFQYRPTKNNKLVFTVAGEPIDLTIDADYRPLVNSDNAPVEAPVVFVGFGLKRDDWNDYAGVDVKGKIVMMFRGYPEEQLPTSTGSKSVTATEQGAVGIIVVGPNGPGRAELPNYSRGQGMPPDTTIPGAGIRSSLFKRLTGMDYEDTRAMAAPMSKDLGITAKIQAELEPNSGSGRDVVGILPGHDPKLKNEYIVVGGHYDHVGMGETGSMTGKDTVHPGADDNASGTTGVVALAQFFAKTKSNKRTIIFQTYQGEELGLLGSEAWAKKHPEIVKKTSVMVNLDMIGRLRESAVEIYGTGTATEFQDILDSVSPGALKPQFTPQSRPDSDHAAFSNRGVPILFFFTGLHPEYHTEKDTFETLNLTGIGTVANYAAEIIEAVDSLPAKLTPAQPVQPTRTGSRVRPEGEDRRIRVGFVPNMSESGANGVVITGASPGSPAEKAGFKAGDRIVEFNGHKLDGLEALAEAMIGPKPGDKIKVVFVRDGVTKTVEVVVEESGR